MSLLLENPWDQRLQQEVHPAAWPWPKSDERYNLVVIGAGTAGLVAAAGAAGLGAKVALVERSLMGGDCLNYGCVPSKALLRAARAIHEHRRGREFGLSHEDFVFDFPAVMDRMRRLRAEIAHHDGAQRFRDLGVDVYLGQGSFSGRDRVKVIDPKSGRETELRFTKALVATGARPMALPVPGLESGTFLTNHDLFNLQQLPESMVVVGAGPIGMEMAYAFASFGSRVRVVSLDTRILPREDPEAAAVVHRALENLGVEFELSAGLEKVEQVGQEKIVHFRRDGQLGSVQGREILLAVGRKANVEDLGFELAGVAVNRNGVQVDDRLQTSNPRVYAAGDVAGMWQFTHAADAMARMVLRNALFFGRAKTSALTIPWSTYTVPEIAHVGLYASQSEQAGTELTSLRMDLSEIDRARLDGEGEGFAKVIFEKKSGRLRGATVVAEHAGELLGEACLAVGRGMKVQSLSGVIHPYPTQVSIWSRLGDASMRQKLTPRSAALLKKLLQWRR
ncbi:MAG: mercuric reductase [Planctomycetota bacterium]|nr:MAG: mercuric reductase [Planctomycetota bacterium]